jgi:hypothetical protein
MKYSKTLSKNTKIGNQALINVPLAKKKIQPKNKKELLLCRERALDIGTCAEGGLSAKRCTLPTARASSRQSPVNRGKLWSTALPRAGPRLSAQVASLPTAQGLSRRHSGRQPKCDGARSFSDGAVCAEHWPSTKTYYAEGPSLPTARPSAKVAMS